MTGSQVVCLGEPLVALLGHEPGPLHAVQSFSAHVTGAELNVAVGVARQGVRVSLVGRRGLDAFGERVERTLRAEGVDTAHLRSDPRAPTGMLVRNLRPFGSTEVQYARAGSAGSRLDEEDVQAAAADIAAARYLHVTGITPALSETARRASLSAVTIARAAGTTVCVDVNLRRRLSPAEAQREAMGPLIAAADLLLCGEDEGEILTGVAGAESIARELSSRGPSTVIVKRGAQGAIAFAREGGGPVVCPARPVSPVDPVGAGDAFAAGLLAARLRGADLALALRAAVTTAACAITARGDIEGLPDAQELAVAIEADVPDVLR